MICTIRFDQSMKLALGHGLPKIHKVFENAPLFCPIIGITHYSVGKYLSELLVPFNDNDYSLKDSFLCSHKN